MTIVLSKGSIFLEYTNFVPKNADISKMKGVLVLKRILCETKYVCVLTYQISSF